jgi:TolA-binding protein
LLVESRFDNLDPTIYKFRDYLMKKLFLLLISGLFLIGCSSKTAEEYKNTAEEHLQNNNIVQAVEAYENLVREYPRSEYTSEALYKLGSLYQSKMISDMTPAQSLEKAADTFRLLQEKHPKDSRAPMALFMAAYIKANELNNYQEATELYNLFLKKYPKHELASSAAQELEIMGLSPDEVLEKKTAAGL